MFRSAHCDVLFSWVMRCGDHEGRPVPSQKLGRSLSVLDRATDENHVGCRGGERGERRAGQEPKVRRGDGL